MLIICQAIWRHTQTPTSLLGVAISVNHSPRTVSWVNANHGLCYCTITVVDTRLCHFRGSRALVLQHAFDITLVLLPLEAPDDRPHFPPLFTSSPVAPHLRIFQVLLHPVYLA